MPSGLRKGGHRSGAWTGGGDGSMSGERGGGYSGSIAGCGR